MDLCKILCIILAFFLPPVAVFIDVGCTGQFWLNCVLTLICFVPGIVHAVYIICTSSDGSDGLSSVSER